MIQIFSDLVAFVSYSLELILFVSIVNYILILNKNIKFYFSDTCDQPFSAPKENSVFTVSMTIELMFVKAGQLILQPVIA